MDETNNNWRQMFERNGRPRVAQRGTDNLVADTSQPLGGYDDGHQPQAGLSLSPSEIVDEAAMALADDPAEYRPWTLQRGRTHPVLMLHLRRHEPKSGLWMGWEVSYPHLVAVEYTGDRLVSLDFGTRQFMIEGTGLGDLVEHLQTGRVLMVQEYCPSIWPAQPTAQRVSAIRKLNTNNA